MNSFGRFFRVQIFGESHGHGAGILIDGCPPGLAIHTDMLEVYLAKRRSGNAGTTERREADIPEIFSGVYNGYSSGAPILILFKNEDTRSEDYAAFRAIPRPGHADFTSRIKYRGFADPRGSGHFSGRITVGLVAAGTIARLVIPGIELHTTIVQVGGSQDIPTAIAQAKESGDSVGALIEIRINGISPGLGEPFFDSLESILSHLLFSVPAVRGVEFGDGFAASAMRGSQHNDPIIDMSGTTSKNGSGGINGGISNGNEIIVRVAVKPASSISLPQATLDFTTGKIANLSPKGRHDVCIGLRAAVVLESACAIGLADLALAAKVLSPQEEK